MNPPRLDRVDGFDGELRRGLGVVRPAPTGATRYLAGATDLLVLTSGSTRRFLTPDPVHAELLVELPPAAEAPLPGEPLPWTWALYQWGSARLDYRASAASGRIEVERLDDTLVVLDVALHFTTPLLDRAGVGAILLVGRPVVEWPRRVRAR